MGSRGTTVFSPSDVSTQRKDSASFQPPLPFNTSLLPTTQTVFRDGEELIMPTVSRAFSEWPNTLFHSTGLLCAWAGTAHKTAQYVASTRAIVITFLLATTDTRITLSIIK